MNVLRDKLGISVSSEGVMELRLFRQLCLAASVLTLLVICPLDRFVHTGTPILLADLGFGLAAIFLYLMACRGRYYITTLYFLYLLNLNVCWFSESGSQGSICLYFFNAFIYAMIFFRDRRRCLLLTVAIANALWLIATEPYLTHLITPYQSPYARLVDLTLSLTMTALSTSLMLWAVLSSYDREQRHLKSLNAELERSMAERIEAEKSLRQNRQLLKSVIEGTSDAVYAKDTEGRYLLLNDAAARITGKSVADTLGKDDRFLFPPAEAYLLMARDQEIIASGTARNIEQEMTCGSGEKIVVQSTQGPLRDDEGKVIGVFGISRDVTDSRRVEEQIRLLNAELDQRVTERTARLRAAIQEQESFSYSISHDLRAPLRHINSYSAILQEECEKSLTPEAHGYLDRIRNASRHMGDLIDHLLELSRIGRSELKKGKVDMSELAREILFRLKESEPQRKAEFIVEPGLTAHGDRVLLQQALENLLDNAWKYTSPRESARIEVGKVVSENQEAFFVRDNGVGFDMAYRDQLFRAFQRLHGAEFEGTGMGLATVKRIVKRHGGTIWAEGAVDEGATITFTLR